MVPRAYQKILAGYAPDKKAKCLRIQEQLTGTNQIIFWQKVQSSENKRSH